MGGECSKRKRDEVYIYDNSGSSAGSFGCRRENNNSKLYLEETEQEDVNGLVNLVQDMAQCRDLLKTVEEFRVP